MENLDFFGKILEKTFAKSKINTTFATRNETDKDMAKKIYITKDLKGIKVTYEVKGLVNAINAQDYANLNEYTLFGYNKDTEDAYFAVAFYALKNGMFQRSIYYDGNAYDLKRITWFVSDLFNCTISSAERFLRTMAHYSRFSSHVEFADRFGLNHFEIY